MMLTFFVSFLAGIDYKVACDIKGYNEDTDKYNFVYFGEADSRKEYSNPGATNDKSNYLTEGGKITAPIKFRVLDTTSNDEETPALFMLTEYAIGFRRWDDDDGQDWESSAMKKWLNGLSPYNSKDGGSVYIDCFSEEEGRILEETVTNQDTTNINWTGDGHCAKKYDENESNQSNNLLKGGGNKIFLLSVAEVSNPKYGFSNSSLTEDINRICYKAGMEETAIWCLRSANSYKSNRVNDVYHDGTGNRRGSDKNTTVVRFALNIPLSSIIYTSDASITPNTIASSSTFKPINLITSTGDSPEYKLTIIDKLENSSKASFKTVQNSIVAGVGKTIKIGYSGAAISTNDNHECISAIIKDTTSDEVLYYAYLKQCTSQLDEKGELTIKLPANLDVGSYKLIVMNERIREAYQTNYAACSQITLNVTENYPLACSIQNPVYDETSSLYNYDYVYFGHVTHGVPYSNDATQSGSTTSSYVAEGGEGTRPIKFRVLNTTSNGYNASSESTKRVPALFMLTEYAVGERRWDTGVATGSGSQDWATSEMRAWLNGNNVEAFSGQPYNNSVLSTCFNEKERNILMPTTTTEEGDALSWYWIDDNDNYMIYAGKYTDASHTRPSKSNQLNGDKIFLLSAEEVVNEEYGFANNGDENVVNGTEKRIYQSHASRVCKMANNVTEGGVWWWLRSAFSQYNNNIANVTSVGASGAQPSSRVYNVAVRFGLNIPLSSIIYASDASDTPENIANQSIFKVINSVTNAISNNVNGYRLTLLDDTRNTFTTEFSSSITSKLPGEEVTISYNNAKTGSGECITVIIKDTKTGEAKCYARYPVTDINDSITVTIPSDIDFGTYELLVMNEQVNASGYTNYASPESKLLLIVRDRESPIVTNVYANADNTMFRLTAKDNYKLDKITTMKNNEIHKYVLDNTYEPGTSITEIFNSTCNMDSFKVYDTGGNATVVLSSNIIRDIRGPRVESITYENGNYTIRVSDTQSGIWKITDSTGNVIYERYDGVTS